MEPHASTRNHAQSHTATLTRNRTQPHAATHSQIESPSTAALSPPAASGLVHADLRPDHFYLIGSTWKLTDLSRSQLASEPLQPTRGAQPLCYCAPEFAEHIINRAGHEVRSYYRLGGT